METIEKTLANQLHDAYAVQSKIEDIISEAFEEHEPDIYERLDFHISSDYYDNSIEIFFDVSIPYPYEPCKEIRKTIYNLGFSIVYWNFLKDTSDVMCDRLIGKEPQLMLDSPDEIRGYEPRHNKHAIWTQTKYGYVDERFNEKEWKMNYKFNEK